MFPDSSRRNDTAYVGQPAKGLVALFTDLGGATVDALIGLGNLTLFSFRTLLWLIIRPVRRGTLLPSFYQIGVLNLPVIALTGTFIGIILAVQTYSQYHMLQMESRLGAVINLTLVRELGPVLVATMLAGRVGGVMAAELATMRVTEQIDALPSMGIDPIHYLVVPRFLACLLLVPLLTMMAAFMGIVGGAFYSFFVLNIDWHQYISHSQQLVTEFDLLTGVVKSLFFGAAIAIVSCYHGYHCDPGAKGVGRAAITAVVQSFVVILVLEVVLAVAADNIQSFFWPDGLNLS